MPDRALSKTLDRIDLAKLIVCRHLPQQTGQLLLANSLLKLVFEEDLDLSRIVDRLSLARSRVTSFSRLSSPIGHDITALHVQARVVSYSELQQRAAQILRQLSTNA